ncbi:hypothetical protein EU96_0233 [Prochlorococcus marinus str. MIT 9302]|uniref:Uncharacterized protein n=1 Tax=Prochlorococcus marinus str. MIT 9302 TaxID=74545 RepID=A0A0A2AAV1_PROMR|nr:hypothetical protein EU96_0233 [Prochlorococcus marinus str. MIT 9302]
MVIFSIKSCNFKEKLNFNLLIITSIAISSVIIVRSLYDYLYVRFIDDIVIFP